MDKKSYLFGICQWLKNQPEANEFEKTDERSIFYHTSEIQFAEMILRFILDTRNSDILNCKLLDLNKLESNLDGALNNETKESLTEWMLKQSK
jgi:hypothetical protein